MRKINTLFLDIGGVLLTNGWDHQSRQAACKKFKLDPKELESRHKLTFDTYEMGKITLEEYIKRVVFNQKRSFSLEEFEKFMFAQSKPLPEMLDLITTLKKQYKLKIIAVSNEGRELAEHRIRKFKLNTFIDFFIISGFVHLRKPDGEIYRLALDAAQTPLEQIIYIDDRAMFVQVAEEVGIPSLLHENCKSTGAVLNQLLGR